MTTKELRRLSRAELLELLIIERKEIDRLKEECKNLKSELKLKGIRSEDNYPSLNANSQ